MIYREMLVVELECKQEEYKRGTEPAEKRLGNSESRSDDACVVDCIVLG
jgi:hypothetical protein